VVRAQKLPATRRELSSFFAKCTARGTRRSFFFSRFARVCASTVFGFLNSLLCSVNPSHRLLNYNLLDALHWIVSVVPVQIAPKPRTKPATARRIRYRLQIHSASSNILLPCARGRYFYRCSIHKTSSKGPLWPSFLYPAYHQSKWLPLPCRRLLSL
jgi:hypothetical protein